jgi:hypothetical protein
LGGWILEGVVENLKKLELGFESKKKKKKWRKRELLDFNFFKIFNGNFIGNLTRQIC